MAGVYADKISQPLNKTQLIKIFLKAREQTSDIKNTLTEEIKEIHRSFKKHVSEIVAVKKALVKQLRSIEDSVGKMHSTLVENEWWLCVYLLQLNMIS